MRSRHCAVPNSVDDGSLSGPDSYFSVGNRAASFAVALVSAVVAS